MNKLPIKITGYASLETHFIVLQLWPIEKKNANALNSQSESHHGGGGERYINDNYYYSPPSILSRLLYTLYTLQYCLCRCSV